MDVTTFTALMKQNTASLAFHQFKDACNRITNILNKMHYKRIVNVSKVNGTYKDNGYIKLK